MNVRSVIGFGIDAEDVATDVVAIADTDPVTVVQVATFREEIALHEHTYRITFGGDRCGLAAGLQAEQVAPAGHRRSLAVELHLPFFLFNSPPSHTNIYSIFARTSSPPTQILISYEKTNG